MRIGVPLAVSSPQAGGGYTFERDVAEALTRCAAESQHQFTIFTRSANRLDLGNRDRADQGTDQVEIVHLQRSDVLHWKWRRWRSCLARLGSSAGRRALRRSPRGRGWLEECLLSHRCEFVWNLAPGTPTFELPYIAMVWDLQHRLQPFFPEVSADSEWEQREDFFRLLLQRATFVVTGNITGREEIERFYQIPSERIRLLPHPTPRFALQARPGDASQLAKWGLSPGYLFYPAQFWPHKNHVGLLRAVRVLRDRHGLAPPVVLVGSDQSNLRHVRQLASELGLASQVHVLGFVSRDELATLYRHAEALVYLTFFGPENLPPLEAMALDCPVIASRVPGAAEQLGDAALLVDPRDPAAIAAAIAQLHNETELKKTLRERGRARSTQFTADHFVRGAFAMLDEFAAIRDCWGRRAG